MMNPLVMAWYSLLIRSHYFNQRRHSTPSPLTRISEPHGLSLYHSSYSIVADVLLPAVLDVDLLGEGGQPRLMPQHVRDGDLLLTILAKLRPVLGDLVLIATNLSGPSGSINF